MLQKIRKKIYWYRKDKQYIEVAKKRIDEISPDELSLEVTKVKELCQVHWFFNRRDFKSGEDLHHLMVDIFKNKSRWYINLT